MCILFLSPPPNTSFSAGRLMEIVFGGNYRYITIILHSRRKSIVLFKIQYSCLKRQTYKAGSSSFSCHSTLLILNVLEQIRKKDSYTDLHLCIFLFSQKEKKIHTVLFEDPIISYVSNIPPHIFKVMIKGKILKIHF